MEKEVFCVIMAGGVGSRFWPMSRNNRPKQFIDVLGTGQTLIQQTYARAERFCKPENIYVVANIDYEGLIKEQLPQLAVNQILLEPIRRGTAPCVALAHHAISQRNSNAVVVVTPSDHLIMDQSGFSHAVSTGIRFASDNDALLTIGVNPSRPETGYGYIQVNGKVVEGMPNLYKVKTFTEKPNLDIAKVFIQTGEFYWNSGVFIWALGTIREAFQKHLPEVNGIFTEVEKHLGTPNQEKAIANAYTECKNISIDYGILEKADNVHVLCAEFGWSDLGTWGALHLTASKDKSGNVVMGKNAMLYNVTNSLISVPNDKLVVIQGLDNVILVESGKILLVCSKDSENEVKAILNDVLLEKGDEYI